MSSRIAFVTGASRGIGRACAFALAAEGYRVALGARNREQLEAVANELKAAGAEAFVAPLDLTEEGSIRDAFARTVAEFGTITVLVNNAGIYEPADVDHDFDKWTASWHRTLQINLVAPGHFCREAIRHFRERGGGIIINLASRAAFRGDDADYQHYAASKAGIVAMTRTIARQYGRGGISAFAIAPDFVRTDLNAAFFAAHGVEVAARDIPLGEIAEPEDIANTVVFLASGLARHATGTTIDINGASYVR